MVRTTRLWLKVKLGTSKVQFVNLPCSSGGGPRRSPSFAAQRESLNPEGASQCAGAGDPGRHRDGGSQ